MDKKNIKEYFADNEPPATVIDVEPLHGMGEHYYKVRYKNEDGEFETDVFVNGSSVLPLPE